MFVLLIFHIQFSTKKWKSQVLNSQILMEWCPIIMKILKIWRQLCHSPTSYSSLFEPQHDKTNKVSVCPAKTRISLGIRPVWSVFAVRLMGS